MEKVKAVIDRAKALSDELAAIEEALYQTKNRASEDPLNFPVRLNNKLAALLSDIAASDTQPTAAQQEVYEDLATTVNAELNKLKQAMGTGRPGAEQAVASKISQRSR